jgi:hypothetical protein
MRASVMVAMGAVSSSVLLGSNSAQAFTLVEAGQPTAGIAVAASAPKVTAFAAAELQAYVQKISGAKLEIRELQPNASLADLTAAGNVILLGDNHFLPQLGLSYADLGRDAHRVACKGKVLAIFGHDDTDVNPRSWTAVATAGTLDGVYRFLERLGVRWYFPGEVGEVVPRQTTIAVSDGLDVTAAPYFPMRLMQPPLDTDDAALWIRRVGFSASVDPAATCHSFDGWYAKYAKSNPEYFALYGQERGSYICFYGKGVRQQMIADAKAYLQGADPLRYPDFTVMENDGAPGPCQCPECQSRLTKDRGWHGLLSDYVAEAAVEVAQAIKDDFPNRGVCIGAYNEYTRPPTRIQRLPPNVSVQLFRHRQQIWSPEARKNVYGVIEGWLALKPKTLSFWDYYNFDCWMDCRWLGIPAVTTAYIADDIRQLKEMAERSQVRILGEMTFCNGRTDAHHQDRLWWIGLDMYLTAKCLWQPDLNREALLKEFYTSYFGPAAGPLEKLYTRAEEVWVTGNHGGVNDYCAEKSSTSTDTVMKKSYVAADPWKCLFTTPILTELSGYMAQAREAAKESPYKERVELVGKGFDFTLAKAAAGLK